MGFLGPLSPKKLVFLEKNKKTLGEITNNSYIGE